MEIAGLSCGWGSDRNQGCIGSGRRQTELFHQPNFRAVSGVVMLQFADKGAVQHVARSKEHVRRNPLVSGHIVPLHPLATPLPWPDGRGKALQKREPHPADKRATGGHGCDSPQEDAEKSPQRRENIKRQEDFTSFFTVFCTLCLDILVVYFLVFDFLSTLLSVGQWAISPVRASVRRRRTGTRPGQNRPEIPSLPGPTPPGFHRSG